MRIFSVILVLCSSFSALAQDTSAYHFTFPDSTFHISEIIFVGNETTKEYILNHEMTLHQGDLLTHQQLKYDIDRIYSLRLFTKVKAEIIPQQDSTTAALIIDLHERWYFYPYPNFGFRDRAWSKFYYGFGVVHTNVGGRNVRVLGEFGAGYDPYVMLNYYNPFIDIDNAISLSLSGYYKEQRNKSLISLQSSSNFYEKQLAFTAGVGKRYSLYSNTFVSFDFLRLSVSDNKAGRTLSATGTDQFFSCNVSYSYDTRDLREYPRLGTLFSIGVSKVGLFHQEVDYQRFGFDFRRFIPMYFDIVTAGRVFGNLSWGGRIPNYGHTFFGYNERLRGHFSTILEGEQILGSTIETHFPIIAPRYVRFDYIPFEQFRDIRYALNAAVFADAGSTWMRDHALSLKDVYSGYGFGLHLLFAYSAILRLEFGIPYGKNFSNGELILDFGSAL